MKLARYKKNNPSNVKNIIAAMVVIILIMAAIGIYRTFAIYKLKKDYDIIQSKVGTFPKGDLQVEILVDGEETDKSPTYEDNYYVEKVECTNGVIASFDVKNWQIVVGNMSAESTKCTIAFDSTRTNSETPIDKTKEELLDLNNQAVNRAAALVLDDIYPVGSIYMTITEDTAAKVHDKLGGTWERFAEGKTLVSANADYPIDTTGGTVSETYTPAGTNTGTAITIAQMPAHSHTFTGKAVTSSAVNLNHRHYNNYTSGGNNANPTFNWNVSGSSGVMIITHGTNPGTGAGIVGSVPAYVGYQRNPQLSGSHTHAVTGWGGYVNNNASTYSWTHTHSFTAAGTNSNNGSGQAHTHTFTGTAATISHMQPYQTTYMYKRVE